MKQETTLIFDKLEDVYPYMRGQLTSIQNALEAFGFAGCEISTLPNDPSYSKVNFVKPNGEVTKNEACKFQIDEIELDFSHESGVLSGRHYKGYERTLSDAVRIFALNFGIIAFAEGADEPPAVSGEIRADADWKPEFRMESPLRYLSIPDPVEECGPSI